MTKFYQPGSFFMAGTEGTGDYAVLAEGPLGAVGVREYAPGRFRVRVEPVSEEAFASLGTTLTRAAGFKQPGDSAQTRWSATANGVSALQAVLATTLGAILQEGAPTLNPKPVREEFTPSVKTALVAAVRARKVPGANFAAAWHVGTLASKLA